MESNLLKNNSFKQSYLQVIREITDLLNHNQRIIVYIGGNSRCGKSYLANLLAAHFEDNKIKSQTITLDDWIIGANERTDTMNVFDVYNSKLINLHLQQMLNGNTIYLESYEPVSRGIVRNKKSMKFIKKGVIIIEGVIALGLDFLLSQTCFKIYVELNEQERKLRFYDFYRIKGLSKEDIDKLYYNRLVTEVEIVSKTKKNADIVFTQINEEK